MMHSDKLLSLTTTYLHTFHVLVKPKDHDKVHDTLAAHLDAVIYNITSIAILFTLLKGKTRVEPKHLADVMSYISTSCPMSNSKGGRGQHGGTSMASDYFGYPHPNYSAGNATQGVTMSEVDFDAGIARAGIESQLGGSGPRPVLLATHDKDAKAFARSILKLHKIRVSKSTFEELMRIIDIHMNCLGRDLEAASPLSLSKLEKILSLKRHSVFH